MPLRLKQRSILPGFGLTMGYTVLYLSLVVLIPLSALFIRASQLSGSQFWAIVSEPRAVASYTLTLWTSLAAAGANAVLGFVVTWTLVRYRFPGRRIIDALIDLPFALADFFAAASSAGLRADRTRDASEHGAVAFARAAFVIQALHDPLKTFSDRDPPDVNELSDFKIVRAQLTADAQI